MDMKRITSVSVAVLALGMSSVAVQACSDQPAAISAPEASPQEAVNDTPTLEVTAEALPPTQTESADRNAALELAAAEAAAQKEAAEKARQEKAALLAENTAAEEAAKKLAAAQQARKAANAQKVKLAQEATAQKLAAQQAAEKLVAEKLATEKAAAEAAALSQAKLDAQAKQAAEAAKAEAAPIVEVAQGPTGDAQAGATVFKKCRACHSIVKGKKKVGPSLYGVVGRTPGTLAGYKFSTAMKAYGAKGTTWDADALSTYLTAPRTMIPKVKMIFPGLKNEQDRLDIIAYLDSLDG
jgi:cytochrome c